MFSSRSVGFSSVGSESVCISMHTRLSYSQEDSLNDKLTIRIKDSVMERFPASCSPLDFSLSLGSVRTT